MQNILILGDSLSAAYGLQQDESWVFLLTEKLRSEHPEYNIVNASVSGATTADALSILPNLLQVHKPSIVIVELGANDGLRGYPIIVMQQNLAKIVTAIQNSNAKVLLVGIQLPSNYGPTYTKAFYAVYQKVANEFEVPLVPFMLAGIATDLQYFQKDKLHPTAAAQPAILNNIWPYLQPLLQQGK
jgi:acyl-CoA thioesterase-1